MSCFFAFAFKACKKRYYDPKKISRKISIWVSKNAEIYADCVLSEMPLIKVKSKKTTKKFINEFEISIKFCVFYVTHIDILP
jgi:hypothetical protein